MHVYTDSTVSMRDIFIIKQRKRFIMTHWYYLPLDGL